MDNKPLHEIKLQISLCNVDVVLVFFAVRQVTQDCWIRWPRYDIFLWFVFSDLCTFFPGLHLGDNVM